MTGAGGQEDGVPDVEEEEANEPEQVIHEALFSFEAFETVSEFGWQRLPTWPNLTVEQKFAHPDITHTLLTCLARYKDFESAESMRRVVSLLHRQAVKAKAEGLFFKVRSKFDSPYAGLTFLFLRRSQLWNCSSPFWLIRSHSRANNLTKTLLI